MLSRQNDLLALKYPRWEWLEGGLYWAFFVLAVLMPRNVRNPQAFRTFRVLSWRDHKL
jgi:hypothetical protein